MVTVAKTARASQAERRIPQEPDDDRWCGRGLRGLTSPDVNTFQPMDAAMLAVALRGPHEPERRSLHEAKDASIVAVAKHCAGLTSLDAESCSKLTDAAVVAVAETAWPQG